jgi:XapX domain-containing protein
VRDSSIRSAAGTRTKTIARIISGPLFRSIYKAEWTWGEISRENEGGAVDKRITGFLKAQGGRLVKLMIGVIISFIIGAGCRYFDIPVPSPPVIPGALLVLAMTIGYSTTNKFLDRKGEYASTSHLCGGPAGVSVMNAKTDWRPKFAGARHGQTSQQTSRTDDDVQLSDHEQVEN